jgi:hypothetical protein
MWHHGYPTVELMLACNGRPLRKREFRFGSDRSPYGLGSSAFRTKRSARFRSSRSIPTRPSVKASPEPVTWVQRCRRGNKWFRKPAIHTDVAPLTGPSQAESDETLAAFGVTESAYVPRTIRMRIGALRTRLLCDCDYAIALSTLLTHPTLRRVTDDRPDNTDCIVFGRPT